MERVLTVCRLGFATGLVWLAANIAAAARPVAPELLPDSTVVYLRVENVPELVTKFRETAMGRILSDEQVQPFVGDLYGSAIEAFQQVQDRIGVGLQELLAIPQGELCIAVVAPDEGRPDVVVLADVGDKLTAAKKLLESGEAALTEQGAQRSTEKVGEIDLTVFELANGNRRLAYFEREATIVLSTSPDLAKQILAVWDGEKIETLASDRRFTAIMNRSKGTKDERPQLTWYADPITLAKRVGRGNLSAQTGLAIISGLGLDGLKAIGGSAVFATEEFDSIAHFHVMLANPREGVIKMIAFDSGDVTPEPFIPKDAAGYLTLNWNIDQTLDELVRLYDTFRGENAWDVEVVGRITEGLELDLEKDLLGALEGRATLATWMERPARLNSQSNLVALRLNDPDEFRKTIEHLAAKFPEQMTRDSYGGVTFYRLPAPNQRGRDNENPDESLIRLPAPCAAILGDYRVRTDSVKFLAHAIVTTSDPSASLASELDFKLIANKIQRHAGERQAGMVSFSRPEENFRSLYELATAPATRTRLSEQAGSNRFFGALDKALTNNPLPPFAVIARYLAPGGGLVTDDETGIHYTAFSLRRE